MHGERIEGQEPADERLAQAQYQLDRLGGLQCAEHARQHPQYPGLGAARGHAGVGPWKQAPVAGPLIRHVAHGLAFEAMYCGRHQRAPQQHAGVVDEVAGARAIRAVEYAVVLPEQRHGVVRAQLELVGDHLDVGIERGQSRLAGHGLAAADIGAGEQQLALEVRQIDAVVIEEPQGADAGGRQVQARRRAQAPGADDQHPRGLELLLAGAADLRQQQVAAIAFALGSSEGHAQS